MNNIDLIFMILILKINQTEFALKPNIVKIVDAFQLEKNKYWVIRLLIIQLVNNNLKVCLFSLK